MNLDCESLYCRKQKPTVKKKVAFPFPSRSRSPHRRQKWIQALKRCSKSGRAWTPGWHSYLCSRHFLSGKPSKDPTHIDYLPTLLLNEDDVDTLETPLKSSKEISTLDKCVKNGSAPTMYPDGAQAFICWKPPEPTLAEGESEDEKVNKIRCQKMDCLNEFEACNHPFCVPHSDCYGDGFFSPEDCVYCEALLPDIGNEKAIKDFLSTAEYKKFAQQFNNAKKYAWQKGHSLGWRNSFLAKRLGFTAYVYYESTSPLNQPPQQCPPPDSLHPILEIPLHQHAAASMPSIQEHPPGQNAALSWHSVQEIPASQHSQHSLQENSLAQQATVSRMVPDITRAIRASRIQRRLAPKFVKQGPRRPRKNNDYVETQELPKQWSKKTHQHINGNRKLAHPATTQKHMYQLYHHHTVRPTNANNIHPKMYQVYQQAPGTIIPANTQAERNTNTQYQPNQQTEETQPKIYQLYRVTTETTNSVNTQHHSCHQTRGTNSPAIYMYKPYQKTVRTTNNANMPSVNDNCPATQQRKATKRKDSLAHSPYQLAIDNNTSDKHYTQDDESNTISTNTHHQGIMNANPANTHDLENNIIPANTQDQKASTNASSLCSKHGPATEAVAEFEEAIKTYVHPSLYSVGGPSPVQSTKAASEQLSTMTTSQASCDPNIAECDRSISSSRLQDSSDQHTGPQPTRLTSKAWTNSGYKMESIPQKEQCKYLTGGEKTKNRKLYLEFTWPEGVQCISRKHLRVCLRKDDFSLLTRLQKLMKRDGLLPTDWPSTSALALVDRAKYNDEEEDVDVESTTDVEDGNNELDNGQRLKLSASSSGDETWSADSWSSAEHVMPQGTPVTKEHSYFAHAFPHALKKQLDDHLLIMYPSIPWILMPWPTEQNRYLYDLPSVPTTKKQPEDADNATLPPGDQAGD